MRPELLGLRSPQLAAHGWLDGRAGPAGLKPSPSKALTVKVEPAGQQLRRNLVPKHRDRIAKC